MCICYNIKQVLPHVDVCMAVRFLRRVDCSSDYIDSSLTFREILEKEVSLMLTISDLIAVFSLCATFYSLGYMHGKHDSKTQK